MKEEQVVIPIRMEKETWEVFHKLYGRNSNSIIRSLIEGYIVFSVLTKKGDKKK